MQTPLEKYFAQRVKNLFNNLHDFELNGDDVSLHDLRVEMKKLRSIIKFFKQVYPKQKVKKPAHILHAIFQQAGEIREYQILQQWLQKNQFNAIEKTYFPPERLEIMIQRFRLNSNANKNDLKEIIEQVSHFVHSTNEILAEQYYAELNAKVAKMCRRKLLSQDWHELRKLIKQRIYAYNWVRHDTENDDPLFSYYNKLQEMIGLWHDADIIKDVFSQKQIYLSQDIDVQKDFSPAWDKIMSTLKQREKQVEEMLSKQPVMHGD
ncbi:MAG TPA: CHAD domain-containing protein [Chitinophagaceae bacterium]|nr:CHAD domain-containing protein [Chitinophagaceae bacterium]